MSDRDDFLAGAAGRGTHAGCSGRQPRRGRRARLAAITLGALALVGLAALGFWLTPGPVLRPRDLGLQRQPFPAQPGAAVALAACRSGGPAGAASLPSVRLPCLGPGPVLDTAALAGRPTLVNLWASWCAPCQRETPRIQAVHRQLGDRLAVVGIDTKDDRADGLSFLAYYHVTHAQLVDLDGQLAARLHSPGLPVTVLLDRRGRIVYRKLGELTVRDLHDALATVGLLASADGSSR